MLRNSAAQAQLEARPFRKTSASGPLPAWRWLAVATSPARARLAADILNILRRDFPLVEVMSPPRRCRAWTPRRKSWPRWPPRGPGPGRDHPGPRRGVAGNCGASRRGRGARPSPLPGARDQRRGHETDFTIADSPPTARAHPFAAAELATPDAVQVAADVESLTERLSQALV